MIQHVSCNGANDGKFCIDNLIVPEFPATIQIIHTQSNTYFASLPDNYPEDTEIRLNKLNICVTKPGRYCWDSLPPGKYEVTVCDSSTPTCRKIIDIEIKEPDDISIEYEVHPTSCKEERMSLSAIAEGGNGNYKFTLSNEGLFPLIEPLTKSTGVFKDLIPSSLFPYKLRVVDSNGCFNDKIFFLRKDPAFFVDVVLTLPKCYNDVTNSITLVCAEGVPPYKYILTSIPRGIYSNVSKDTELLGEGETRLFENLPLSVYQLKVIDGAGCVVVHPEPIRIFAPLPLSMSICEKHINCNNCCNGEITLSEFGGGTAPYIVNLSPGFEFPYRREFKAKQVSHGDTIKYDELAAGTYTITMTDSVMCEKVFQVSLDTPYIFEIDI